MCGKKLKSDILKCLSAQIMLKHYKDLIDREIKILLVENNVKIEYINENRVKRFYRSLVNGIGMMK